MKYYLIAMGAWNLVRAFIHSFHHGYDILFEMRMLACIIPLCFAALIVAVERILPNDAEPKEMQRDVSIPRFKNIGLAPEPRGAKQSIIFIEEDASIYVSSGDTWLKT